MIFLPIKDNGSLLVVIKSCSEKQITMFLSVCRLHKFKYIIQNPNGGIIGYQTKPMWDDELDGWYTLKGKTEKVTLKTYPGMKKLPLSDDYKERIISIEELV